MVFIDFEKRFQVIHKLILGDFFEDMVLVYFNLWTSL